MKRVIVSVVTLLVASAMALTACSDPPAPKKTPAASEEEAFVAASKQLAAATDRLAKVSRPATDAARLAEQLKLDPASARALVAGSSKPFPAISGSSNLIVCHLGGICTCKGMVECTDLFVDLCRRENPGGQCIVTPLGDLVCACSVFAPR